MDHPFLVDGKGWTAVEDMGPGDQLISANGAPILVKSIEAEGYTATTYNLTVANAHTFFVGEERIWVHNQNSDCGDGNGGGSTSPALDELPEGSSPAPDRLQNGDRSYLTPDGYEVYEGADGKWHRRYDGDIVDHESLANPNSRDPAAQSLADEIGGKPQQKVSSDPNAREFDAISDDTVAETKETGALGSSFRKQARAVFQFASETGRKVLYRFDGPPSRDTVRKLREYAERYGVELQIKYPGGEL